MSDSEMGKRMVEDMVLEQLLDSFPRITGRKVTDDCAGDFPRIEGSPGFVVGLDGKALGIELAEIRGAGNAWDYYAEASRLALQKHESYAQRNLFANPIALVLHSKTPPLFDLQDELLSLVEPDEFESTGIWRFGP